MVLVGSVELSAEVDAVDVDAAVLDDALAVEELLAWMSTNSFCSAELKLDPLVLVEFTAPVLLVLLSLLDDEASDDDGSNEVLLLLLLLLPEIFL